MHVQTRISVAPRAELLQQCHRASLNLLAAMPGEDLPQRTDDPQNASTSLHHGRVGLVLGSEGQGLSDEVAAQCSAAVSVPMRQGVESLNVAAAGAIFMMMLSDGLQCSVRHADQPSAPTTLRAST